MTVLEGTIKIMITCTHAEKATGKVWTGPEEWQVDQRGFFCLYNSVNTKSNKAPKRNGQEGKCEA